MIITEYPQGDADVDGSHSPPEFGISLKEIFHSKYCYCYCRNDVYVYEYAVFYAFRLPVTKFSHSGNDIVLIINWRNDLINNLI